MSWKIRITYFKQEGEGSPVYVENDERLRVVYGI